MAFVSRTRCGGVSRRLPPPRAVEGHAALLLDEEHGHGPGPTQVIGDGQPGDAPPTTVTRRLFMPGTFSVSPSAGTDLCRRLFQARLGEARPVIRALAILGAGAHARDGVGRQDRGGVARPTAEGRDGEDLCQGRDRSGARPAVTDNGFYVAYASPMLSEMRAISARHLGARGDFHHEPCRNVEHRPGDR